MADLSSFVQDGASGLFIPPQARRNVIPWDELQTLSTPQRLSQLSPDLISALSVMVAQGPRTPFLVKANEHGAIRTVAEVNATSTIARAQNAGDSVLMVSDPTFAGPGDAFIAIGLAGVAQPAAYQVNAKGQDPDGTLHLVSPLSSAVAVGDGVRRIPVIGISALFEPLPVTNDRNSILLTYGLRGGTTLSDQPASQVGTTVTTAGTTVLRAGVGGLVIYVYGSFIEVDGQTAGTTVATIEDDTTGLLVLGIAVGPLENDGQVSVFHAGMPLGTSNGLRLNVRSIGTGATVRCGSGIMQG